MMNVINVVGIRIIMEMLRKDQCDDILIIHALSLCLFGVCLENEVDNQLGRLSVCA